MIQIVTRHQEDNLNEAASSLFLVKIVAVRTSPILHAKTQAHIGHLVMETFE